jgi:hypothetical protein
MLTPCKYLIYRPDKAAFPAQSRLTAMAPKRKKKPAGCVLSLRKISKITLDGLQYQHYNLRLCLAARQ